ncbi:MAG: 3-deoxy-D-manno-octulosonic acid transferase [Alphaproteobacteria bacterium]
MMKKFYPLLLLYYSVVLLVDGLLLIFWLGVAVMFFLTRRESFADLKQRFGFCGHRLLHRKIMTKDIVWLHAPSLGETLSILPLITSWQKTILQKDIFFVITCQSPTAKLALKKSLMSFLLTTFPHKNFHLSLAPFDNLWLIKNNWRVLRPAAFILAESDFLPRRSLWLRVKKIPSYLLNGRVSKKTAVFFKCLFIWRWIIFSHFRLLWAQSSTSQYYLSQLSKKSVHYDGNLKLYKKTDAPQTSLVQFYKNCIPVDKQPLLFACLHKGEEKIFLELYKKFPELKKHFFAIIVPRHPRLGLWRTSFAMAAAKQNLNHHQFIQVTTFGHLPSLYHLCPLVLLGGSWVNRGGHNPKEALDQGGLILHGKYIDNAIDIYQDTDHRHLTYLTEDINIIYKKIIWFKALSTSKKNTISQNAKNWQTSSRHAPDKMIHNITHIMAKSLPATILSKPLPKTKNKKK